MRLFLEQITKINKMAASYLGSGCKTYLFGSRLNDDARGGDVDLLVVTSEDTITSSFKEKLQITSGVSKAIRSIKKKFPVDLIVHTKAMHRKFLEMNSLFAQEIVSRGIIIKSIEHAPSQINVKSVQKQTETN